MSGVVNFPQYTVQIMASLDYLSRLAEDVLKGKSVVREDGVEVDLTVPYSSPQTAEPEDAESDHDVSRQQEHSGAPKETQGHQENRKKGKNARRRARRKITTDTPTNAHSGQAMVSTSTIATTASIAESVELSAASNTTDDSATTANQVQPVIVGLYGISGAGKSHLLRQLSNTPLAINFDFIDGSALIDNHFGLAAFKKLNPEEQIAKRAEVMSKLVEERRGTPKGIVVSGHMLFWGDETRPPHNVGIDADWETYTHIVYLRVDPTRLHARRKNDKTRDRGTASTEHLEKWQTLERGLLRGVCYKHGIVFTTIAELAASPDTHVNNQFMDLLMDFLLNNKESNLAEVDIALDNVVAQHADDIDTMLVLDADKTLAAQDTGSLFWMFMNKRKGVPTDALHMILKRGYSYESFFQVALLYEEVAEDFDYMCNQVAVAVEMYPEMAALLARVAREPHVGAIIVTSGLRKVWERVLRVAGLTHVQVIGNGRRGDGYVVTDAVKGHIVDQLKQRSLRVVAFGDSPLDVEMLRKADDAYVVVGTKQSRSVSMESKLLELVQSGCSLRQILLPPTVVEPCLTGDQVPIVKLDDATLNSIFRRSFVHATSKASAKLLMTPTRDASNSGHDLRKAHAEVGYALANEYIGEILGIESYPIKLVTGENGEGFRVRDEEKTLIIPLMRGGEPMAFGVSKALRQAAFVHSKKFGDIDQNHFKGRKTIILVDSVVNSGTSIVEYLVPLREKLPDVKIVVAAGVVQEGAVKVVKEGTLGYHLRKDPNLTLVALRTSLRKFTGKGTTDTGHRLFNTTYLD
jgi:uracil phosphoribosyltransferase/phosphoserine phosphatase/adenylate kinase